MQSTTKNPVIHFEILGRDADALRRFYASAFGWPLGPAEGGMDYTMVHPEGAGGISGGIGSAPEGPGHVTFYVGVDDLDGKLGQISQLGGRTVQPPTPLPNGGAFALFSDPEGHVVGLVRD